MKTSSPRRMASPRPSSISAPFGCVCGLQILIALIWVFVGGFAVEYSAEFWLSYFKNTSVDLPLWACMLCAVVIGGPAIPIAAVTWIISFAL